MQHHMFNIEVCASEPVENMAPISKNGGVGGKGVLEGIHPKSIACRYTHTGARRKSDISFKIVLLFISIIMVLVRG